MAITRAQQYRQMLKDGNFVMQGGVRNYLGKQKTVSDVPLKWQSGSDKPATELAYITKAEKDLLLKKDIHGSLKKGPNKGPEGIMSLDSAGDKDGPVGGYSGADVSAAESGNTPSGMSASDAAGFRAGALSAGAGAKDTDTDAIRKEAEEIEAASKARARAAKAEITKEEKKEARINYKKIQDRLKKDRLARQTRIEDILSGKIKNFGLTETELNNLKAAGLYDEEEGFTDPELTDSSLYGGLPESVASLFEKSDKFSGAEMEAFKEKFNMPNMPGLLGLGLNLFKDPLKKGSRFTKDFFTDDVLSAGKFKYKGKTVTPDMFKYLSPGEMDEVYGSYMSDRQSGETDAYGNPTNLNTGGGGEGNNYVSPIIPEEDDEEDTTPTRNLGGLAPRFAGSIFDFTGLADGGRAGYQQGGSIMPRLNDLGTDVSSAEQMLQEINQRLESAESTLGEGGGDPASGLIAIQPNNFNNFQPRQMPIGQPTQTTPFNGLSLAMPNAGGMLTPAPSYGGGLEQLEAIRNGSLPNNQFNVDPMSGPLQPALPNNTYQGMEGFAPQPGGAIQSPLQQAVGMADGGRAGMMDGGMMEDTPEGGIMDLESGRQMYFLGKLVKKATRAVKKVAKSPLGKAALMYGLGSLGAGFLGKAQAGTGTGFFSGLKGKLFGTAAGKGYSMPGRGIFNKATEGLLGKLGITKGSGSMMPTLGGGISLGLGLPFALDALGVGKDEDKGTDLDEYYKTQGIDIDAIRNNPNRILARRFMAEGGDAEPVAKKTMPLLDMDGQEMDLRKDGGFVPIGRMERADDVPARLSKNEFVFTADAVRNAGEGDIDKGAEVMYNMMKNLESGGEVSEESQGLEGAREMFKTSQRLEEVL
jgi:hypothetical protein